MHDCRTYSSLNRLRTSHSMHSRPDQGDQHAADVPQRVGLAADFDRFGLVGHGGGELIELVDFKILAAGEAGQSISSGLLSQTWFVSTLGSSTVNGVSIDAAVRFAGRQADAQRVHAGLLGDERRLVTRRADWRRATAARFRAIRRRLRAWRRSWAATSGL